MTSRTRGVTQQRFIYSGLDNVAVAVGAVQAEYGRGPSGGLLSLQEGAGPALGVMSDLHGDVVTVCGRRSVVVEPGSVLGGEPAHHFRPAVQWWSADIFNALARSNRNRRMINAIPTFWT